MNTKVKKTARKALRDDGGVHKETERVMKRLEELKPFLKKKLRRVYSNTWEWETLNSDIAQ